MLDFNRKKIQSNCLLNVVFVFPCFQFCILQILRQLGCQLVDALYIHFNTFCKQENIVYCCFLSLFGPSKIVKQNV